MRYIQFATYEDAVIGENTIVIKALGIMASLGYEVTDKGVLAKKGNVITDTNAVTNKWSDIIEYDNEGTIEYLIPDIDKYLLDALRLNNRESLYDLIYKKIHKDLNCVGMVEREIKPQEILEEEYSSEI